MNIKLFKGLKGLEDVKNITQVVVYDDYYQPLAILSSPASGVVIATTVSDDNFYKVLSDLGLNSEKRVRVTNG